MDINNLIHAGIKRLGVSNYFSPHENRCSWGPRKIKDIEMIYQVEGTGTYQEEDRSLTVRKNEVIFIPPDTTHTLACSVIPKSTISCIHFTPTGKMQDFPAFTVKASPDPEILMLFKRISIEFVSKAKYKELLALKMAEELLLRIMIAGKEGSAKSSPQLMRSALDFIRDNKNKDICRKDIAKHIGVTPEYLNILFQRNYNATPIGYLNELRIDQAKKLLLTSIYSIYEIAYMVGFKDPFYFSRVFKKFEGVSPRKFRNTL